MNDLSTLKNLRPNQSRIQSVIISANLILLCLIISFQTIFIFSKEKTPTNIFDKAIKYVVEIKAVGSDGCEAYGSGVLLNDQGVIVTNYHVLSYTHNGEKFISDNIQIRFAYSDDYQPVDFLTYDENNDIAILKINNSSIKYQCAKINLNLQSHSGDTVYAVGNTSNYGLSISQGIIGIPLVTIEYSNQSRSVIQCDLSIAEGNSGGALLNEYGELIGITTFRTKDKNGNIIYGLSYSVPIEIIYNLITEL